MRILGIETSCDETAMAVLAVERGHTDVLANVVSSQVKLHAKYGGVVPSLASREHAKNIGTVFDRTFADAGITDVAKQIDAIAVTRGPGLGPSLIIGITFAKVLALAYDRPLIGVNHLDGHVHSNWLEDPIPGKSAFPALCVVVSGGHTELVLMRGHGSYQLLGYWRGIRQDRTTPRARLPRRPRHCEARRDGQPRALPAPPPYD